MLMPQFNPGLHPHSEIESQNTVRLRREAGQIKEIVARISGCNTFHGMGNFLENSQCAGGGRNSVNIFFCVFHASKGLQL